MSNAVDWEALRLMIREKCAKNLREPIRELRALADVLEREQGGLDLPALLPAHLILALRDDYVMMQSYERHCPVGGLVTCTIISQDKRGQRYRTFIQQGDAEFVTVGQAMDEQDRRWEAARKASS